MNSKQIGRWELGCIVFNSLVFKLFSLYPDIYVKCGGSAAWNNALYCGAVFLIALWVMLKIYTPYAKDGLPSSLYKRGKGGLSYGVQIIFSVYFIASVVVAVSLICSALKETSFPNSPLWYTAIFVVGAALITTICGRRAVYRMHSLCVFGIGITLGLIALLGFKYADIYSITPVFGKGISDLYIKGLLSLYMYSDIFVLFFIPYGGSERSYKKTVMTSASLAVLANFLLIFSFSLNFSYELSEKTSLIAYPLTKGASIGKFPLRLDIAYMLSLITSGILYLSVCFNILKGFLMGAAVKIKRLTAAVLGIILCFTLCGCYDSSEVEERAYIIAIGIDKGESLNHKYTFQISNPLKSGGNKGGEEKPKEESSEEGNKTVDNITVEAEDFYTARTKLQAYLSKESDMSHIKLMVLSKEVAYEDALTHSGLMLKEREVRPATNICLADSAMDFLKEVKPTLEESTVRYYELLFRKEEMPYAPVTELRDFVGRCVDGGFDAVAPVYGENGLYGMGIFKEGKLVDILSGEEVLIYNMLSGQLGNTGFYDGGDGAVIESVDKPEISIEVNNDIPHISVMAKLKVNGAENENSSVNILKIKGEEFLYKTAAAGCDVLGFGRRVKAGILTQKDWEEYKWSEKYKNATFSVNLMSENVKNK